MKIAYFDTIAGISGDMTLGAFISAGVSFDDLVSEIRKLNLLGVELAFSPTQQNGITAIKFEVIITGKQKHHRGFYDIVRIIDESALSSRVKNDAKKIFMEVAKAETKIHNASLEQIHFHEVGALDSIVDIVGTAICLEKLNIGKIYSSPVKLGSGGFVETEHGVLPLPSPAAVEILKDYPIVMTDIPFELTTPTGAAVIKAMSSGVLSTEQLRVESVGYGAGTHEIPQIPNLLRVMICESIPIYEEDEILMVEANIDNMNPEIYPYVIEQLIEQGARDAYMIPVIMKKGRPGILLTALADKSQLDKVLKVFFSQTTTIGLRIHSAARKKLKRDSREIQTTLGKIKVKVIVFGDCENMVPEYDECKRLAVENKIPLLEVYKIVERDLSNCRFSS